MLGEALTGSYVYLLVFLAIGLLAYGIWSGAKGAKEDERYVFKRLSEQFGTRPESYVVRSLSAPKSSAVGNVKIGECSAMTSVYSGPNEVFIHDRSQDAFFTIPWSEVESVNDAGQKRISLLVNGQTGKQTRIEVPWSTAMTMEGWERTKETRM